MLNITVYNFDDKSIDGVTLPGVHSIVCVQGSVYGTMGNNHYDLVYQDYNFHWWIDPDLAIQMNVDEGPYEAMMTGNDMETTLISEYDVEGVDRSEDPMYGYDIP